MKKNIHPKYGDCTVKCVCGNTFQTKSTISEVNLGVCGACHPVYTGKKRVVDSTGRVDRFKKMLTKKRGNVVSKKVKRTIKSEKKAETKSTIKDTKEKAGK